MKRRNSISGNWSARLIEMMESPAYRVLSRAAHRVISRIEIELGHHGGNDNGQLPVTFDQFVQYGVHPASVAPAVREAEALGFIRIIERGRGGNAEHRSPNKFLLTFAHGRDSKQQPPTHNWRRIKTQEQAEQIAHDARAAKDQRAIAQGNRNWRKRQRDLSIPETGAEKPVAAKTFPATGFRHVSIPETGAESASVPLPETGSTGSPQKPVVLSIFRGGGGGEKSGDSATKAHNWHASGKTESSATNRVPNRKTRAEWLAHSLSKGAQPWLALGMSRSAWYRQQSKRRRS
ncbi:MAG: hypothetical protein ACLP0B_13535 [Steroidobacteraceae bacterium]